MRKIFLSIFFLFWAFLSFAQSENIPCIIFVDGKLPNGVQGFLEYNDGFNQKDTIIFYCRVGIMDFKSTDFEKLKSLHDTTTIMVHINFVEFNQKKRTRTEYHYYTTFPLFGFFYKSCIVFSITNFNKKKGTYYFDYAVSNMVKPWHEGYDKRIKIFHDKLPYKPKKRKISELIQLK
jgi:hypothetical protein